MAVLYPVQVMTSGDRWVKYDRLTQREMTSFVQEQSLNDLMAGKPFGVVIGDAIQYAIWWQEKQAAKVRTDA